VERRRVTRFAAPVAFLAAITAAALLVRAGLEQGSRSPPHRAPPPAGTTAATTTTSSTTGRTGTTGTQQRGVQTYTIQSGDTLESIAQRMGTTVARLEQLNPGVDPTALQVGETIRVQ